MDSAARAALDDEIRALCEREGPGRAAEVAIRGYGPELFGFLLAIHRDPDDAADVFSAVTERLWKGLGGFAWECSFRTWAYTLARNASHTFRAGTRRRASLVVADAGALSDVAERVRTETLTHLKTSTKDRMRKLRESLSPEDQMLLTLRIDRDLAWEELARIVHEGDEAPTPEELDRESARLRQRFRRVKERLAELALREGLLGDRAGAKPRRE